MAMSSPINLKNGRFYHQIMFILWNKKVIVISFLVGVD
jgi:hypothetical protein